MHRLLRLLRRAVREHGMWQAGERVVVGLSAGPDSTALLAALVELPASLAPRVVAAHFHHGMRGAAADADAQHAEALARWFGVPFVIGRARRRTAVRGMSEAAARSLRYGFLAETAEGRGIRRVAVGHQRHDQVETILMRLGRGSGAEGLAAMPAVRPLGRSGDVLWLVRPLLSCGRDDVLDFLAARAIPHRLDETNDDLAIARNRVRHVLLPALEAVFGGDVGERVIRAGRNARDEAEALSALAQDAAERRLLRVPGRPADLSAGDGWDDLAPSVRVATLRAWWSVVCAGPPPGRDSWVRAAGLTPGGRLDLPGGSRLERAGDRIRLVAATSVRCWQWSEAGTARVPGVGRITVSMAWWPGGRGAPGSGRVAVGALSGVRWPLTLRPPAPGERVRPRRSDHRRAVRGLLASAGVPAGDRGLPWVLADAGGRVLWIAGSRACTAFRAPAGPGPVLRVTRAVLQGRPLIWKRAPDPMRSHPGTKPRRAVRAVRGKPSRGGAFVVPAHPPCYTHLSASAEAKGD